VVATPDQVAQLRRYVDEPTEDTYTDVVLSSRIDTATSVEALASIIWLEKAAAYARLVDMQEGSSRRSLSQLQAAAMRMSTQFAGGSDTVVSSGSRTTTRAIERA
jgi:methyl coenzyme M reductase alpha subunit